MTSQEYKDLAVSNGYKLGSKTDAELLADYAFHKAACVGMEDEVFNTFKDEQRGQAMASFHKPYRVRFMMALDGLDIGTPEDKIWENVCGGRAKKSEVHDKDGKLILSKI